MKLLGLLAVVLLCGCSTPHKEVPVHWFTFPQAWVSTYDQRWADVDLDFVSGGLKAGVVVPSEIQLGFREDGIVVWRKAK